MAEPPPIGARAVVALGIAQLVAWGVSHYLIGVFGPHIAADLGWSRGLVYGGFSLALVVMGLASPWAGRWIDRHGGQRVMPAGAVVTALGCGGLALSYGVAAYLAAWVVLGLGMRLVLYDAAFASLARIGGAGARRAMSQITLFGGLASTTFWPLGEWLAGHWGWRGALGVYAACALATAPLLRLLPRTRAPAPGGSRAAPSSPSPPSLQLDGGAALRPAREAVTDAAPASPRPREAALLYAGFVALTSFLVTGFTSHLVGLLGALGLAAQAAVAVAALFGVGQIAARLWIAAHAHAMPALRLNLLAACGPPAAFAVAAAAAGGAQVASWAAVLFVLVYGAANGTMTITRGTMPLALFEATGYGARTGRLLAPAFFCAAAAPYVVAVVVERIGARGTLAAGVAFGALALAAAGRLARLAPAARA